MVSMLAYLSMDQVSNDDSMNAIANNLHDNVVASPAIEKIIDRSNKVSKYMFMKVEEENKILRITLNKLNSRIGDEVVSESDSTLNDDDCGNKVRKENVVNTRHYQIDSQFADKYYFITNVGKTII